MVDVAKVKANDLLFISIQRKPLPLLEGKSISLFANTYIGVKKCQGSFTKASANTKQPWQDLPGVPPRLLPPPLMVVAKRWRRRGSRLSCQKEEGRRRRKKSIGRSMQRHVPLMGAQILLKREECAEGMGQ